MRLAGLDTRQRRGWNELKGMAPFEAVRAALTYPLRYARHLAEVPEGSPAQITYYAHRVTDRRAA